MYGPYSPLGNYSSMAIIRIIILSFLLSACIPVAVGTVATTTGIVAAQERSTGSAVDDTGIYWKIKNLYLQQNAQDLLAGVGVTVIEGRVHLTGNVDTPETRIDAVRLSWQPKGVKEVINEININNEKTLKNAVLGKVLKAEISAQLVAAKGISSLNYSIEVVNSVVYLMGIAQNQEELDRVTEIISKTNGVERVVSHVIMKDAPERNL
jgi:osmotically-inducible protein OsmY